MEAKKKRKVDSSPDLSVSPGRRPSQEEWSPSPSPKKKLKTDNSINGNSDVKPEEHTSGATSAPKKTFRDLGLMDELCESCTALGYKHPTPVQVESIPYSLQGRDVIGVAETGSGKTAAFALPILQALMQNPSREQRLSTLVLAPTRELAYQTSHQFKALGSLIGVQTAVIIGGEDMVKQAIELSKNPHVLVATPGRLLDHLENTKGFSLRRLKHLVMDEADRLLDMDFGPSITKILKELPREGRRTSLFSATMNTKVESLQRASLQNPVRISVNPAVSLTGDEDTTSASASTSRHRTVATLLQSYLFIPHKHKDVYLLGLLSGPFAGQSAIVFVRTQHEVARLTYLLRALGLGAIPLHGQLGQSARLAALNKFKARSREVLVATNVAERGLDIPRVDLVLNYDLPDDDTSYVHRVGRTARAGKSGHAVSLVTQYDVEVWLRIEKALGQKVDEYKGVSKDEVMVLAERVGEAQREAVRQLKEEDNKKNGAKLKGRRKDGKKGRDDMDRDEG